METLGRPCPPPFRRIGDETEMRQSFTSWFWVVGSFVHPLRGLRDDSPNDVRLDLLTRAQVGFEMFLNEPSIPEMLPTSAHKAKNVHGIIRDCATAAANNAPLTLVPNAETIRNSVYGFTVTLQDELDRIVSYTVTPKGSLDVRTLVKKLSEYYPKSTLELLDKFITDEIDHAGRCLAFELPTSCGFHILRAVETSMKGYLHAATGELPKKMNNRNWGEYIQRLENNGAHTDLIDVLRVLKSKRNPLMHPTDNLDVDEAISLLCICQAGIDVLVADVRRKSLEARFKESLELMPTL